MTSNYNFQHHSQEAELTPRSKSMRENSMPQVTVGAAKGNLEKRRSFNFAKWPTPSNGDVLQI